MPLLFHRAPHKTFEETIVFTHHFGGNHESTKRHQEFVNELGFDCVSFDLNCSRPSSLLTTFRADWIAEIHDVLDQVPGNKIMFTFSSPSVATLGDIAESRRQDVRAWICDGGPFFRAYRCLKNYYKYIEPVPLFVRDLVTMAAYVRIGAVGNEARVRNWFRVFPREISILSIRAGLDKLVPPEAIDEFFSAGEAIDWQRFELPEAQHLEGLKSFPDVYKARVKGFLLEHARAIKV